MTARTSGIAETLRAVRRLPPEARREARKATEELSERLARIAAAAGRADTRQSARAASTVRASRGTRTPAVTAGPHPLLFGSEYGADGRYGWYAAARYEDSPARQFRPHRGAASYWFHRSVEEAGPVIDAEWDQLMAAILRAWG